MVTIYPKFIKPKNVKSVDYSTPLTEFYPSFVIHPPTSELAERLLVDPTSLSNENYSGIYDESGDYIPQYCDNPEDIPRGSISANIDTGTVTPSTDEPTGRSEGPATSSDNPPSE